MPYRMARGSYRMAQLFPGISLQKIRNEFWSSPATLNLKHPAIFNCSSCVDNFSSGRVQANNFKGSKCLKDLNDPDPPPHTTLIHRPLGDLSSVQVSQMDTTLSRECHPQALNFSLSPNSGPQDLTIILLPPLCQLQVSQDHSFSLWPC